MSKRQTDSILEQLDASPTPRHLVDFLKSKLLQANFADYSTKDIQNTQLGFIARAGSLIAWKKGKQTEQSGFRIVGAHTDSPGLRIKPNPDDRKFGFNTLQVEIYGSPLLNSWLDRDLGIAGHVVLKSGEVKLFRSVDPVARISQLAVHLDREVNERGLTLDKHLHLSPAWSSDQKAPNFMNWVAKQTKCTARDIAQIDAHNVVTDNLTVSTLDVGNLMFRDNEITTTTGQDIIIDGNGSGGVRLANFRIVDNTITNVVSGAITQIVQSGTGYFKLAGTNGFVPPRGDNAQRPTAYAVLGMTRFNTVSLALEVWDGASWASPAGSAGAVSAAGAADTAAAFALILG